MNIRSKLSQFLLAMCTAVLVVAILPLTTAAQDDPPAIAGRVAYLRGSVSFQPAGTDDWVDAVTNRPVTIGDKLWSDQDSLAELHLGASAIRLGSNTSFTILNLDSNVTQVSINEGILNIHLRALDDNETYEVDTPNLAFSLLRPGDYRVEVNETGDVSLLTVRRGEGDVTGGGQAFSVRSGQSAEIDGTDQINAQLYDAYPPDDFDNWCNDRNRYVDDVPRYVSPYMVGYEDLNGQGAWRNDPEYGAMWIPNGVVVGWAPYRYGHWAWISPWGWTWVDDASWGFAPFHYGRWVAYNGGWGWLPGPVVEVRPVYAPALVAWVGGPGAGIGVGVAWFPLGPREVFVPPYAVSARYVTNVNITSTNITTVQVTNVYNQYTVNKTITNVTYVNRGAVTATSQAAFTSAQPVGRNIVKVDPAVMAKARIGPAAGPGVAPEPRSVMGSGAAAPARARPPAAVASRAVVAKRQPPPPPPSFAAQQSAIKANGGRPIAVAQLRTMTPAPSSAGRPGVRVAPAAKPVTPPAHNTPPPANAAKRPAPPAAPPAANRPPMANPENKPAPPPANANRPPANNNRPPAANPENKPAPKTEPNKPAPPPGAKPNNEPAKKPPPKQNEKEKKANPKDEKDKPQGM